MLLSSRQAFFNLQPSKCGMATLKDIAVRLRSVKNIQKITASMKMVSTSKFSRAERDLRAARPYGQGARMFYTHADLSIPENEFKPNTAIVAITSDRGLCGAANSYIVKSVRSALNANPDTKQNVKLVLVGDKSRAQLVRTHRNNIWLTISDVGKKSPTFEDAALIAEAMLDSEESFDQALMYYNTFKSVISYQTTKVPLYTYNQICKAPKFYNYDPVDREVVQSFSEFLLVSTIFAALKEGSASEQSARMTAMDSATKNAGEMIDRLTLLFNRTRQAVITRELTEIISGAAAV